MSHSHSHDSAHGNTKLYWVFCVILCAITFVEWGILHMRDSLGLSHMVLIVALSVMSLVKFAMVVGWYMHLRYDPTLLKQVFIASCLLILGIAIALVVIMTGPKHALPKAATTSGIPAHYHSYEGIPA